MTFHTPRLAPAAGVAVLCLSSSFAGAMEPPKQNLLPPLEHELPPIGACSTWDYVNPAITDYLNVAQLETNTGSPVSAAPTLNIFVEPETRKWVIIADSVSKGPCIDSKGSYMEMAAQIDQVASPSPFINPANDPCEPFYNEFATTAANREEFVSLHGTTSSGEDIFLLRNGNNQWSVHTYRASMERCHFSTTSGPSSNFTEDMMMSVFGRTEETILPRCPVEVMAPLAPMPNAFGSRPGSPFIKAAFTSPVEQEQPERVTNTPFVPNCYDYII